MSNSIHLYIFVTSNAPDVYINVIRHCMEHYSLQKTINFVGMYEDRDKEGNVKKYLKNVIQKVEQQISNLSQGKYSNRRDTIEIEIEDYQKVKYSNVAANYEFSPKPILYEELETELKKAITEDCIFDVSGFQKDYLVDVYTILHLLENTNVHYFKIKTLKERTFDDKELIHNLHLKYDYEFENISESIYTQSTVVKSKEEIEQIIANKSEVDLIIDKFGSTFARIWVGIIRAILIICLLIGLWMLYKKRGDWDTLEPLTFLAFGPVAVWLINLIIGLFGSNAKEALNLKNIENLIKSRKIKELKNNR